MKKLIAILMTILMVMSLMNLTALAEGASLSVSTDGTPEKEPCICVSVSWTEINHPVYHYGKQYWNTETLQYYEKDDDKTGWVDPLITTVTFRNDSNVSVNFSINSESDNLDNVWYNIKSPTDNYMTFYKKDTRPYPLGYATSKEGAKTLSIEFYVRGTPDNKLTEPAKLSTLSVTVTPNLTNINPGK